MTNSHKTETINSLQDYLAGMRRRNPDAFEEIGELSASIWKSLIAEEVTRRHLYHARQLLENISDFELNGLEPEDVIEAIETL